MFGNMLGFAMNKKVGQGFNFQEDGRLQLEKLGRAKGVRSKYWVHFRASGEIRPCQDKALLNTYKNLPDCTIYEFEGEETAENLKVRIMN